jgi:hypothetical protein
VKPADVQVPSNVKLLVSPEDYCRISDFAQPADTAIPSDEYVVGYSVAKGCNVTRSFKTKEAADEFIDLLQQCSGVKLNSGPDLADKPEAVS